MKNDRCHILKITAAAVMIALICVLTLAVRIPTPSKGYLNLGDCAVLLSGWLLGPIWGAAAGGVGSALADIFAGYPIYAPGTLLIKAVMAAAVALVPRLFRRIGKRRSPAGWLAGAVFAEAFMVAGYWLYEAAVIGEGFAAAVAGVSGNVFQGVAGVAGSYFLIGVLRSTDLVRVYGIETFAKGRAK